MTITEAISSKILVLDGGMGTMVQRLGIKTVDNEQLNLTHPDAIEKIHKAYIEAGADIIETNSFGANRFVQQDFCLGDQAPEMAYQAACIARRAADNAGRQVFVAGSVGPTGKSLSFVSRPEEPAYRECSFEELKEACKEQIGALVRGGVDCILLETCFDALNTKAAICAIDELGAPLPVIISVTVSDRSGRTLTGQKIEAFYNSVCHCPNLIAFGINCALGAREMVPMVKEIASFSDLPLIFYPNAGLPDRLGQYGDTPQMMAEVMLQLADEGIVNIIGGCCGTTPEHIKAIANAISPVSVQLSPVLPQENHATLGTVRGGTACGGVRSEARTFSVAVPEKAALSQKNHATLGTVRGGTACNSLTVSGLECVTIDKSLNFTNIGERTNVAGSKKFARLIAESNYGEALQVAADQIKGGADIIDVNMDDPMVDSTLKMREFLRHIAGEPEIARAAIMIDSSHWDTILEGLRNAQGRCIVNSISLKEGEDEFLRKARTIRSYGAAMVVMAFDEQGQAVTFDRKVAICRRSYDLLTGKAQIPPQDIIFDCNILSIGTGIAEHARFGVDFIEAVRWIKANLPGAKTSGGLSNLSFAFRGNNAVREAMHSVFLYHAVAAGLDMAIVNPQMLQIYDEIDPELRKTVEEVIFNTDAQATSRLVELASAISDRKNEVKDDTVQAESGSAREKLVRAIIKGGSPALSDDLQQMLDEGTSAVSIIEGPLMEGMEKVGQFFAEGKMFLPQVVKSARTMQDAVTLLKPYMGSEEDSVGKPKFLIATVQGDVHDIGKNIVAILLRCSGFEVIDLGVMVPCREIVDAAVASNVDFIGLSGLITPSLHYMEEICTMLRERNLDIPVFVGGAATSELFTAVRLAPLYGKVFYGAGASDTAVLAKKMLISSEETINRQHTLQARIREMYENSSSRDKVPAKENISAEPAGPDTFKDIPLTRLDIASLMPYFDWKLFRAVCNIRGTASELEKEASEWLSGSGRSVILCARFFNCRRIGNDIAGDGIRIPMLKAENSLLDYIPQSRETQIGAFAVRVEGESEPELLRHAALVTLAEAGAEWMRRELRMQLPEEMQLLTPGIGYSCLPDHTLKREVLSLLPQETGITLTPTCAMIPEASVCGLILAGKGISYIDPQGVAAEDIEDYADRRNMTEEEKSIFSTICSTFIH